MELKLYLVTCIFIMYGIIISEKYKFKWYTILFLYLFSWLIVPIFIGVIIQKQIDNISKEEEDDEYDKEQD